MRFRKIDVSDRRAWMSALRGISHAFFHTWDCVDAIAGFYRAKAYLYVLERSDSILVAPAIARTFNGKVDLVSPYGYAGVLSENVTREQLDELGKHLKADGVVCSYLTLNPLLSERSLFSSEHFFRTNTCYAVDLRLPVQMLLKKMHRKSQVRLKGNLQIVREQVRLVEPFIKLYQQAMKTAGASHIYRFDDVTLKKLCDSENSFLLGVESEGQIIAATLTGWTSWVCDFLLSGATREARRHSTPLLWTSMMLAREKGVPWFNLGGGMREHDSLARYKANFGGSALDYGALKLVHNPWAYAALCRGAGYDHRERRGFFPAYREPARESPIES